MTRAKFLKAVFRPERKRRNLACWALNIPPYLSDTGKRKQLFFDTQAEAEVIGEQYRVRKKNFGIQLAAVLSPKDISEAAECLQRLKPYNISLLSVVLEYIERRKRREASVPFLELANRYIDSRHDRHRDHLSGLRVSRDRFPQLHDRMASEISHEELEELLSPVSPGGRDLLMRHFRSFFNYAIEKGWVTQNPIARLEFPRAQRKEVQVVDVAGVRRMLEHAAAEDLPLLPYLVFGFFGGLRPEDEMLGLQWTDLDWNDATLTVPAAITKMNRRRFVKLEPNAIAWLRFYEQRGGKLSGKIVRYSEAELKRHRLENREAAGIAHWPNSGMRHSFASYHLAKFKDINTLCLALGHTSPTMLWNHYHKAVKEEEALRYWDIQPPK